MITTITRASGNDRDYIQTFTTQPKMNSLVARKIKPEFIAVDEWHAVKEWNEKKKKMVIIRHDLPKEDAIFRHTNKAIILPIAEFWGVNDVNLDYFVLGAKRCYYNEAVRAHTTHYLNYFLKFYDEEHELLAIYYNIKYMMDYEKEYYTKYDLMRDIKQYILSGSILFKIRKMNSDNYYLPLKYKNTKNPELQYTDEHAEILMELSLLMNAIIPLITHFMHVNNIVQGVTDFILEFFDIILHMREDVDIYNKLYETAISSINKSRDNNAVLYNMQHIRGRNANTHSIDSVINIIVNIMPKYTYDDNIIKFNFSVILNNIGLIMSPFLIVI